MKLQHKTIDKYLNRWGTVDTNYKNQEETDTAITIVIPCFNEDFVDTKECLVSLINSAKIASFNTLVFLILNDYQGCDASVKKTNQSFKEAFGKFNKRYTNIEFVLIEKHFRSFKEGGVGFARKLGMDTALARYAALDKPEGIIVCLDADTSVHPDYLSLIKSSFNQHVEAATSIGFAHRLDNDAIVDYELHLRYFINMQRVLNLPYAYQTIGSAMAVKAFDYAAEGGMSKRQAGEDFYFLQKFISKQKIFQITKAIVYPSSRESDRVPFGTGKAVREIHHSTESYTSYHPSSFKALSDLPILINKSYHEEAHEHLIDDVLLMYLKQENYLQILSKLKSQSTHLEQYTKQFFLWFNAFRLFKYLHFARDHKWPNIDIESCLQALFVEINLQYSQDKRTCLIKLREYDEQNPYSWDFNAMQV